jgi:ABC-type antimicrobial peptide transport system permease subunit
VREFSIRTALGAGRRRFLQQLLTEAFVLSFSEGALGSLILAVAVRLFIAWGGVDIPRLDEVHISGTVMLFSLLLTMACACLFGLFSAYRVSKSNLQQAMRATPLANR